MKHLNKYGFIIIILTIYSTINGQNINCIDSDLKIGCAPFVASINNCSSLSSSSTLYEYETGKFSPETSYTYNNAGLYDVRQIIGESLPNGVEVRHDSLFEDFFRVVSTPKILVDLISCKNKQAYIKIDSSSYDYYVVTNNINTDSDTIIGYGTLIKSFTGSTENKIDFHITANYLTVTCGSENDYSLTLIDEILPFEIYSINEFEEIKINQKSVANINYHIKTISNGTIIDSNSTINNNLITLPISDNYDSLIAEAIDYCNNNDSYIEIPSFQSETTFSNNQNKIEYLSGGNIDGKEQYIKFSSDTTILNSTIDINITCGSNDCYAIQNENTYSNYTFQHISTGTCGTSFSLDKPTPPIVKIDNSSDSTIITLLNKEEIDFVTFNNHKTELINNKFVVSYSTDCFDISQTNLCNQTSDIKNHCPLNLELIGNDLIWNTEINNTYSLAWISVLDDTNYFETEAESNYNFELNQYFAQQFCIIVIDNQNGSISNKQCFEDQSFLFIPELIYKSDKTIKLRKKYIAIFSFKIIDMNGNLVKEWNENSTLMVESLDSGTYFYIFEGVTQNDTKIHKKGSFLIKD